MKKRPSQRTFFSWVQQSKRRLFELFGCALPRDAAEHDDIRHGVPTDAVAAMDASCAFPGGVKAGQHVAFLIQYLGRSINLQPPHGVVNRRLNFNGIVRTDAKGLGQVGASKGCVLLGRDGVCIGRHGRGHLSLRHLDGFGQRSQILCLHGIAFFDVSI